MHRRLLPNRRRAETMEMCHQGQKIIVTMGYYNDGAVGEVFLTGPKTGSDMDAILRDAAVLVSLGLQHHVPVEVMRHAVTREPDGKASTIVGAVLDRLAEAI